MPQPGQRRPRQSIEGGLAGRTPVARQAGCRTAACDLVMTAFRARGPQQYATLNHGMNRLYMSDSSQTLRQQRPLVKSEIARVMERHKSTIGREMKRNRGPRGYRPKQAQEFSQARLRAGENSLRIAAETWAIVDAKLAQTWSPEQISGSLRVNEQPTVRHEAIYPRIYADKRAGGTLHRALR